MGLSRCPARKRPTPLTSLRLRNASCACARVEETPTSRRFAARYTQMVEITAAARRLDLPLEPGALCLLGEPGAGKSTMARTTAAATLYPDLLPNVPFGGADGIGDGGAVHRPALYVRAPAPGSAKDLAIAVLNATAYPTEKLGRLTAAGAAEHRER